MASNEERRLGKCLRRCAQFRCWRWSRKEEGGNKREDKVTFEVKVVRGEDLKNQDFMGKQDPYCVVTFGDETGRTAVVHGGGTHPEWDGDMGVVKVGYSPPEGSGEVTERPKMLDIKIYDEDKIKPDDFIGEVCLRVDALESHLKQKRKLGNELQVHRYQFQVYRRGTKKQGRLTVEIRLVEEPQQRNKTLMIDEQKPDAELAPLIEATPAKVHKNQINGAVQALEGHEHLTAFLTHQIALQLVAEVFGDAWNSGEHGQHPHLFDNRGFLIRGVLSSVHKSLYMDVFHGPECMHTHHMFLGSGNDFLELIQEGSPHGRKRVYTYTLLDTGLFFSETGVTLSKDHASKHAIHGDAAMKVRYAGTFRVCWRYPQPMQEARTAALPMEAVLVIDNDSGTYRPDAKQFGMLESLLVLNFPGLKVRTLDVTEDQPTDTLKWAGPKETGREHDAVYAGKWKWKSEPVMEDSSPTAPPSIPSMR